MKAIAPRVDMSQHISEKVLGSIPKDAIVFCFILVARGGSRIVALGHHKDTAILLVNSWWKSITTPHQ